MPKKNAKPGQVEKTLSATIKPKPLKYHRYTGESVAEATREAIHAYKQAGDSLSTISKKTKLGVNLIQAVLHLYPPAQPVVDKIRKGLAGKLYRVADSAVNQIEPDSLQHMTPYQNMGIAGLAIQNARLIEGQSTQNVSQLTAIIEAAGLPDETHMGKEYGEYPKMRAEVVEENSNEDARETAGED
jgi:hypothetical protein